MWLNFTSHETILAAFQSRFELPPTPADEEDPSSKSCDEISAEIEAQACADLQLEEQTPMEPVWWPAVEHLHHRCTPSQPEPLLQSSGAQKKLIRPKGTGHAKQRVVFRCASALKIVLPLNSHRRDCTLRPPLGNDTMPNKPLKELPCGELQFESRYASGGLWLVVSDGYRFESGNLAQATMVWADAGKFYEYDMLMSNDTNTAGHTQW